MRSLRTRARSSTWLSDLVVVLAERGRGAEIPAALVPKPAAIPGGRLLGPSGRRSSRARQRCTAGWVRATSRPGRRCSAAEHGERVDLVPARAYFERIGAMSNLRRCESVLPASA